MSNAVTSYESWTSGSASDALCWNCNVGQYLVYESDATQTSRCGQCGELEQDKPQAVSAKVETPKTRPATRRATAKPKDKV